MGNITEKQLFGIGIKEGKSSEDGSIIITNIRTNRMIEYVIHKNIINMDFESLFDIGMNLKSIKNTIKDKSIGRTIIIYGGGHELMIFKNGREE